MSGTKSSGPLRAVQWSAPDAHALRAPDGGQRLLGPESALDSSVSIWDAEVNDGDVGSSAFRMDIPSPYDFGDAAADRDGWAAAQTTGGAGNLTLTGANPLVPLEFTLYSTGNLSAVTFTVTGLGIDGSAQTEALTGPNNATKTSTKAFSSVTQVAVSAAVATAVEVGWSDSAESKSVVHPSVVHVAGGWGGYRYWLAFTPYRRFNSAYENPCIVASNDCITWVAPAANPIVGKPNGTAYLSDPHLYLLPDGSKLVMMYRDSGVAAGQDRLLVIESVDGVTWSAPVVIWSAPNSAGNPRLMSPSFFHDGTNWVIYAHDTNAAGYPLKRMARAGNYASLAADWSALVPAAVALVNPRGESWWHSHLIRLPNGRIIGVASDNDSGAGQMWLLQSDDGTTFWPKACPYTTNMFYRNSVFVAADATGRAQSLVVVAGIFVDAAPSYRFYRLAFPLIGKTAARQNAILAAADLYALNANDRRNLILAADGFTGSAGVNVATSADGKTWVQNDTNNVQYDGAGGATNENTSNCIAWIDVGAADYSAQITYSVRAATGQVFLNFRQVDVSNRWRFGCSDAGGAYDVQSVVAGSVVYNFRIFDALQADGDVLRVEADGARIRCYINGRMVHALDDATHLNGTCVGLQLRHPTLAAGVKVDDFLVHRLS